jgi:hypothetical protein
MIGASQGAEFRFPLGLVIVGGVLSSALLTFFVVPAAFYQFERKRYERLGAAAVPRGGPPPEAVPGDRSPASADRGPERAPASGGGSPQRRPSGAVPRARSRADHEGTDEAAAKRERPDRRMGPR